MLILKHKGRFGHRQSILLTSLLHPCMAFKAQVVAKKGGGCGSSSSPGAVTDSAVRVAAPSRANTVVNSIVTLMVLMLCDDDLKVGSK